MSHTYIWFDIGYTVILTTEEEGVEVEAYKHVGRSGNRPLYESEMDMNSQIPYLEEAKIFCEARVGWEGCSDWRWNQEECMVHLCNKEQIVNMGKMLKRIMDEALSHLGLIS